MCLENPFGIWFLAKSHPRSRTLLWVTGVYSSWAGCVFQVGRVCISYFFYCCDRVSDKIIPGKKVLKGLFKNLFIYSSIYLYFVAHSLREARQQEYEAAGYIVSPGRKQREEVDAGAPRIFFFLLCPGTPRLIRPSHSPSGWVLPSQLYLCGNSSHRHTQRGAPRGLLNPVKLTTEKSSLGCVCVL